MKKFVIIICFGLLIVACKNNQATNTSSVNSNNQAQIAFRQDSIKREKIFAALGDTVFGKICYGMSKTQFQKAINEFKKPLKDERTGDNFNFAGYSFDIYEPYQFEDKRNWSKSDISSLEYSLSDKSTSTLFYKGELVSVNWTAVGYSAYLMEQVTDKLNTLISYFEKRYGKPVVNNADKFDESNIEIGYTGRQKVMARWETNNRKIVIYYQEIPYGERSRVNTNPYQYDLEVTFLDKQRKRVLNEHIQSIIQKIQDEERAKERQKQKNMENAL